MPSPIIFGHISQRGVDPSLRCNGVRTCREQFCDTGGFKTGFCQADCCSETCSTGSHYYCVVVVVDDGLLGGIDVGARGGRCSTALRLAEEGSSLLREHGICWLSPPCCVGLSEGGGSEFRGCVEEASRDWVGHYRGLSCTPFRDCSPRAFLLFSQTGAGGQFAWNITLNGSNTG